MAHINSKFHCVSYEEPIQIGHVVFSLRNVFIRKKKGHKHKIAILIRSVGSCQKPIELRDDSVFQVDAQTRFKVGIEMKSAEVTLISC